MLLPYEFKFYRFTVKSGLASVTMTEDNMTDQAAGLHLHQGIIYFFKAPSLFSNAHRC